jgi:exopolysaccharide biosynthesis polyprenyl glycosylphosphotransferase
LAAADVVTALAGSVTVSNVMAVEPIVAPLAVPGWIVLAKLHGLYDRDHRALRHLTTDELPSLLAWGLTSSLATAVAMAPLAGGDAILTAAAAAAIVVASAAGIALRSLARWTWRCVVPPERTLILGDGTLATATRRKLALFPDIHCVVLASRDAEVDRIRRTGRVPSDVDRVIAACADLDEALVAALVQACRAGQVKLTVVPPPRGAFGTAVQLKHVADLPVVEYNTWDVSRSTLFLKRCVDLVIGSIALVVIAPLLALVAIAVKTDSRGPVFFRQLRVGYRGEVFRILKFRTMVNDAEQRLPDLVSIERLPEPMFKLAHDPRVTRLGRFLRRTSLDELPQLLNVVRGQMSLVGPRPEQVEVADRYTEAQRFRLDVKPGVTGPMQVFGRGELTFEERLAVEREYIENLSVGRDFRLLAMTVRAVATGRGAF